LRIGKETLVVNCDPSVLAYGYPRSTIPAPEPRDDFGRLGAVNASLQEIIVGKGDIEGIQLGLKGGGSESVWGTFEGMIVAAKVRFPILVP
jgi:hypothetical protein